MKSKFLLKHQSGVASLFTAIVLLTCITLVALFTSKNVLMETKMTGDNNRAADAQAAATASMSAAVSYFMNGGLDNIKINPDTGEPEEGSDCEADTVDMDLTGTGIVKKGGGQFRFFTTKNWVNPNTGVSEPNICGCNPPNGKPCALVWARGWSDDETAVRTMTQCLTLKPIFEPSDGKGPVTPFFSASNISINGSGVIINRYTNSNIWTSSTVALAGTVTTHLRADNQTVASLTALCDSATCTDENGLTDPNKYLNSTDPDVYAREISNKNAGDGVDIIKADPNLAKTPDEIFSSFFGSNTRDDLMNMAEENGQKFTQGTKGGLLNSSAHPNVTGLNWFEGNLSLNGGDVIGSPSSPVILIINGSIDVHAQATIYGAVYVVGNNNSISGGPIFKGSLVFEKGAPDSGVGGTKIVYVPFGGRGKCPEDSGLTDVIGAKAVIAGSWKDW
jgi:hypothetical protein